MKDWIVAGLIYVPTYQIGKWISHFDWADPYLVGWMVAALSVCLRWGMSLRRESTGVA